MSAVDSQADTTRWVGEALERFGGPLEHYAQRLTGDPDRARDAVQETFLWLCRQDPGSLNGNLRERLYTVCRSRAIDAHRKDRRLRSATLALAQKEALTPEPNALAEHKEDGARMREALTRLPALQQEVVRLKFQHGLSYREIARVTGRSVTNVGFILHKAMQAMRNELQGRGVSGEGRGENNSEPKRTDNSGRNGARRVAEDGESNAARA